MVRVTHWLTFIAFMALLVDGRFEIVISHPRFYWGEVGNVNTKPLFVHPHSVKPRYDPQRLQLCDAGPEWLEPVSAF